MKCQTVFLRKIKVEFRMLTIAVVTSTFKVDILVCIQYVFLCSSKLHWGMKVVKGKKEIAVFSLLLLAILCKTKTEIANK